ncbi:MAG: butyrate kinase [Candidatus Adiutrix sp.]|jgi:butyrate kinase|nr:butyrate kinase [Candidatus Adiutrix sp.]
MKILVINPGSTSTKIAVYEDETTLFMESVEHDLETLQAYPGIYDQYGMRAGVVGEALRQGGFKGADFSAVVARGGLLPRARAGAYLVTPELLDTLRHRPQNEHISNIGAALAQSLAEPFGLRAYIYDPVTVDELEPIARVTGFKEMERRGQGHNLNMRAAAIKKARELGRPYDEVTSIVVHMGGGITMSLHHQGRIIDMISDDEGSFSPERAGGLPGFQLIALATGGQYDYQSLMRKYTRQGGLMSHFGTTDARAVLKMMEGGDRRAALVLEAMCHNVARNVAKLAVAVRGRVEHIVITGGLAHCRLFCDWIGERVGFIAPVTVIPGENEMEALALGALRVLRGEEEAREYHWEAPAGYSV